MVAFIILAIVFLAFQTLALRKVKVANLRENLLVTGFFSALIAVGFWIWVIITQVSISTTTVFWGACFGVTFVTTILVYYYAMQSGPLSYTTFFFSASMIIPSVAGIIFWKEPVKLTIMIGIALFLCAFYLISVAGARNEVKATKKWMLFCFLSWLINGGCSIVLKCQQTAMEGTQSDSMMAVSFSFAVILCLLAYIVLAIKDKQKSTSTSVSTDIQCIKRSLVPAILVAVGSGGGNVLVSFLSSRVPSAYLFPFVLGGLIIVVTIYSAVILKEKVNKFGMAGIIAGIVAIVMINL